MGFTIKQKQEAFTIDQAAMIIAGEIRNMCGNDEAMMTSLVSKIKERVDAATAPVQRGINA